MQEEDGICGGFLFGVVCLVCQSDLRDAGGTGDDYGRGNVKRQGGSPVYARV